MGLHLLRGSIVSDDNKSRVRVRYLGDEPLVLVLVSEETLRIEPNGPHVAVLSDDVDMLIERGDFEVDNELNC